MTRDKINSAEKAPPLVAGPTGKLADKRRENLRDIFEKRHPETTDRIIHDIENLDALKGHPQWIRDLTESGAVALKSVTRDAFFPDEVASKKKLERAHDGITALKSLFERLGPEMRRAIARDAFTALADTDETADVALTVLLDHVLVSIRKKITDCSTSFPSSDQKLQAVARLAGLAAIFHKHGLPIAGGSDSLFIKACKIELRMARSTVQKLLPNILPKLDQHMRDVYGEA